MKKNEEQRNLTWKLGALPTAGELAELVDSGVISKDEARDIMFGNPESDKEKIEALEKLVDFLQGLVKDLTKSNKQTFVPYERTIYVDRAIRPYFDRYWMSTSKKLGDDGWTLTANNAGTMTASSAIYSTAGTQPVMMSRTNTQDAIKLSVNMGKVS